MFPEEARWIRSTLGALPLRRGASVLDIGSSTRHFRTVEQPYIDGEVFAPLRARGAEIVHLDAKPAEGVDVVCDLTDPETDVGAQVGRRFDMVLCSNLLEHVTNRAATVARVRALVGPGGGLIVTVPGRYRYHEDPIDTMYRPSPSELAELIGAEPGFTVRDARSVRIRDRAFYKFASPYLRERIVEGLFWLLPRYNWRQSCVHLTRS